MYPYAGPGGRNYLKQAETLQDIALSGVKLEEGARLHFYCGDADDEGKPDDLLFDGIAYFDSEKRQWYVIVEESSCCHALDSGDSTNYDK